MFANRLKKNAQHLSKWARKADVSCYRVYDADMPEYAVAIDLYEDRAHIQEYAAPKSIDPIKAAERLATVISAVPTVLSIPESQVFVKVRQQMKGLAQYEKIADSDDFFSIREFHCRFLVNLCNYLDTGLFLDHRLTRKMLGDMCPGRRFLNLFCYTASASVYAALGQAISVTSVDLSNTYLAWAKKNFALNGLTDGDYRFIRADCLQWLQQQTTLFDLILLDPPSFSNSKKMSSNFDVLRDQGILIDLTMRRLDLQGVLIFSTNRKKFRLAAQLNDRYHIQNISRKTLSQDFARRSDGHQCWMIRHRL